MHSDCIFLVLLIGLFLLVVAKQLYPIEFSSVFELENIREAQTNFFYYNLIITFAFCFLSTFLLFLSYSETFSVDIVKNTLDNYLFFGAGMFSFVLARYALVFGYFHATKNLDSIQKYLRIKSLFGSWQLFVLIAFGFLFFFSFLPKLFLFYAMIFLVSLLFFAEDFLLLSRIFKQDLEEEKIAPSFHIILYLCVLEILPQAVVIKSLF